VPELALKKRHLEQLTDRCRNPEDAVAGDWSAQHHGGEGVVRRNEPWEVRIDPQKDGDAIEVEQEGERDCENRMEAQKR